MVGNKRVNIVCIVLTGLVLVGTPLNIFFLEPVHAHDYDPLVDQTLTITIQRVRKILVDETPSFYLVITIEGERWKSNIFMGDCI